MSSASALLRNAPIPRSTTLEIIDTYIPSLNRSDLALGLLPSPRGTKEKEKICRLITIFIFTAQSESEEAPWASDFYPGWTPVNTVTQSDKPLPRSRRNGRCAKEPKRWISGTLALATYCILHFCLRITRKTYIPLRHTGMFMINVWIWVSSQGPEPAPSHAWRRRQAGEEKTKTTPEREKRKKESCHMEMHQHSTY